MVREQRAKQAMKRARQGELVSFTFPKRSQRERISVLKTVQRLLHQSKQNIIGMLAVTKERMVVKISAEII